MPTKMQKSWNATKKGERRIPDLARPSLNIFISSASRDSIEKGKRNDSSAAIVEPAIVYKGKVPSDPDRIKIKAVPRTQSIPSWAMQVVQE